MNKKVYLFFLIIIAYWQPLFSTDYWFKGPSYYAGRFDQARKQDNEYPHTSEISHTRARQSYLAKRRQKKDNDKELHFKDNISKKSAYALGRLAEYVKKNTENEEDFLEIVRQTNNTLKKVAHKRLVKAHTIKEKKLAQNKNSTEKRAPYIILSKNHVLLQKAMNNNGGLMTIFQERDVVEYGNAKSAALVFNKNPIDIHPYIIMVVKKAAILHAYVSAGFDIHAQTSNGFTVIQRVLEEREKNPNYAWLFDRFIAIALKEHIVDKSKSITGNQEILPQQLFPELERRKVGVLEKNYCSQDFKREMCESAQKIMRELDDILYMQKKHN